MEALIIVLTVVICFIIAIVMMKISGLLNATEMDPQKFMEKISNLKSIMSAVATVIIIIMVIYLLFTEE